MEKQFDDIRIGATKIYMDVPKFQYQAQAVGSG